MGEKVKRIAVTGGAGNIAYNLLFRIASGEIFGKDVPIALHILEVPEVLGALKGVQMELEDSAFPLLHEIQIGSDPYQLFRDVNLALLVGAKPRGAGMERKDLLLENAKIFVEQGRALDAVAAEDVQILVIGNPCNTNCLIALHQAKRLPKDRFHAMTRLDQNRAVFQLASKAGVPLKEVSDMTIWGNHSSTMVPDFVHAKIKGMMVVDVISERSWLEKDFVNAVQKRGSLIIEARGRSSAASAASAIIDAAHDLYFGKERFSSAILSDGNPYGIAPGLVFSFPCVRTREECRIVSGLTWDKFLTEKIHLTEKELLEERDCIRGLL